MEAVNEAESSSPPSTVTTVAETVKLMAFLLSYFPSYSSSQYSRPFDLLWPKPITRDTSITESIGESTACDVCGAVHQTLGPRSPFQTFITWVRQQIFKLDLIADSFTTSLQLLKRCIYIYVSPFTDNERCVLMFTSPWFCVKTNTNLLMIPAAKPYDHEAISFKRGLEVLACYEKEESMI